MTTQEMHTAFKVELDKTNALELPAFEPEEIDYWLNTAMNDFVLQQYRKFEQSQEIADSLRNIVEQSTIASGGNGTKPNSYTFTLPTNYMFILDEQCEIAYGDPETTKIQGVIPTTLNDYVYKVEDPHSEHRLHYGEAKPLRLLIGDQVELVTDGNYTTNSYFLRYLRHPAELDVVNTPTVEPELADTTHMLIVSLAVRKALENIEQQRFGTYAQEQKLEQ